MTTPRPRQSSPPSASTPSALILDFGGVLTHDLYDVFRDFAGREGLDAEALVQTATTDPDGVALWHALERGDLGQVDFEHGLAKILGIGPDRLLQRLADLLCPNETMLAAVADLRQHGVKTAVLSNSWGHGYLDPYAPWCLDTRVDVVVLSDQVKMRKPEPEIFHLTTNRLGVPAAQCVFIDDIAGYLDTPTQLGVITIHHTDTAVTVAQLAELFGTELSTTTQTP